MENQEPTTSENISYLYQKSTVPLQSIVIGNRTDIQSSSELREFGEVLRPLPGISAKELLDFQRHKATSRRIGDIKEELKPQREVLARLRLWHMREDRRRKSFIQTQLSRFWPVLSIRPSNNELRSLVAFYFPPHELLSATICDFGEGRFERFKTNVDNVRLCAYHPIHWASDPANRGNPPDFSTKPSWVTVRWMQVKARQSIIVTLG